MIYTIDRIEGKYAVCETPDREIVDIPLSTFPFEISEGTRFKIVDGVYVLVQDDEQRKQRIRNLMEDLFKRE